MFTNTFAFVCFNLVYKRSLGFGGALTTPTCIKTSTRLNAIYKIICNNFDFSIKKNNILCYN